MRGVRFGLLVYVLATIVAPVVHDHDAGRADSEAHELCCDDSGLHISGHPSSALTSDHHDCLSCQYRSQTTTAPVTQELSELSETGHAFPTRGRSLTPTASYARWLGRAPPIAEADSALTRLV